MSGVAEIATLVLHFFKGIIGDSLHFFQRIGCAFLHFFKGIAENRGLESPDKNSGGCAYQLRAAS